MDIINLFIEQYGYTSYLEVGTRNNKCFKSINAPHKEGVDPDPVCNATHVMTSDEYFSTHKDKFDIVFIDGLHHADQVYRDINNALNALNENGTIVCHDMNPLEEAHQKIPPETALWNGDCWKAWVRLKSTRHDLEMRVVTTDQGCGIIRRGYQPLIEYGTLDWENLERHRERWLGLIGVNEFLEQYGSPANPRVRPSPTNLTGEPGGPVEYSFEEPATGAIFMTDVPTIDGDWEMMQNEEGYLLINRNNPTRLGYRCNASAASILALVDGDIPLLGLVETIAGQSDAPIGEVFDGVRSVIAGFVEQGVVRLNPSSR
jgi:hypothetical protein